MCNKDFLCAGIGGLPSPVNEGYKVKKKVTSHELSSFSYTKYENILPMKLISSFPRLSQAICKFVKIFL